jgi:hypothetical protein
MCGWKDLGGIRNQSVTMQALDDIFSLQEPAAALQEFESWAAAWIDHCFREQR